MIHNDADKYALHETQMNMESSWDISSGLKLFIPLTKRQAKRGWKPIAEIFTAGALGVSGRGTKLSLAYLLRD